MSYNAVRSVPPLTPLFVPDNGSSPAICPNIPIVTSPPARSAVHTSGAAVVVDAPGAEVVDTPDAVVGVADPPPSSPHAATASPPTARSVMIILATLKRAVVRITFPLWDTFPRVRVQRTLLHDSEHALKRTWRILNDATKVIESDRPGSVAMVPTTRDKLFRAAEHLMAERGVDNVTFAEITEAAGQRNNSAVPYYFGDRQGLISALLERHTAPIAERRSHLLDALDESSGGLRDAIVALVEPIVEQVQAHPGGADYIRIVAHLASHPDLDPAELGAGSTPVSRRLNVALVARCPKLPPRIFALRMELLLVVLFHGLADHARTLADPTVAARTKRLFVNNLIDTVEAILVAQPSTSTMKLSGSRSRS